MLVDLRAPRPMSVALRNCALPVTDCASLLDADMHRSLKPCPRLPCDERCSKTLKCGHRCASREHSDLWPSFLSLLTVEPVCGEACNAPCIACAEPDERLIVDSLSMQFGELAHRLARSDLPSIIVKLPCRHVFSVARLDEVVGLEAFYVRDEGGSWSQLVSCRPSLATLPTCPDCNKPFFLNRYGRPIRHVDLGLSEGLKMRQAIVSLNAARSALSGFSQPTVSILDARSFESQITLPKARRAAGARLQRFKEDRRPLDLGELQAVASLLGIPKGRLETLQRRAKAVIETHQIALKTSSAASAYYVAWEQDRAASIRRTMELGLPFEEADKMAWTEAGGIPRQPQSRYRVEGILVAVQARAALISSTLR